jgi:hypothetical protein
MFHQTQKKWLTAQPLAASLSGLQRHHIGVGAAHRGSRVTLLVDDLHVRVIGRHSGELIRELILDPTRDYQPRGLPPGPPKRSSEM